MENVRISSDLTFLYKYVLPIFFCTGYLSFGIYSLVTENYFLFIFSTIVLILFIVIFKSYEVFLLENNVYLDSAQKTLITDKGETKKLNSITKVTHGYPREKVIVHFNDESKMYFLIDKYKVSFDDVKNSLIN
jgi:hypothetical protein